MPLIGILFKASYLFRRHQWSGLSLDRWLALLLVLLAGLMAIRLLPGGAAGVLACAALVLLLLALQTWAGQRDYLAFRPRSASAQSSAPPMQLDPADKLAVRATGLFEVEGKEQAFSELQAYFRSFQSREHAVMAIVPPSRLLLIGQWPQADIGMWYIFFKNGELRRIELGDSYFGRRPRPALRLAVEQEIAAPNSPLEVWGIPRQDKPKPKVRRQTVYLSFDGAEARDRVLADLLVDASRVLAA